jgi:hypothetical protein
MAMRPTLGSEGGAFCFGCADAAIYGLPEARDKKTAVLIWQRSTE